MNQREKQRRTQKLEAAKRYVEQAEEKEESREATPEEMKRVFLDANNLKSGDKVILIGRVSKREQYRRGNLADQEENLRGTLTENGVEITDYEGHVGPGWNPDWLREPKEKARKANAVLVAETPCRYLRNPDYHSENNPYLKPRLADLEKLKEIVGGIPLYVLGCREGELRDTRSYQTKRGILARRNKETIREKRKRECLKLVTKLYKSGLGYDLVATAVKKRTGYSLSATAIKNWLKKKGLLRKGL